MAFPTTPIIDDFNRADEDPIASPWVSLGGTPTCEIVSNQFASSGAYGQAYHSTFVAADLECYATVAVATFQFLMMFRMNGETDGTKTGYEIINDSGALTINTHQPGGGEQLGTVPYTPASGDAVGARARGDTIEVWLKPVAGSWTLQMTVTNSRYRLPGRVSLQMPDTIGRWDNFGGRDLPGPRRYRRLIGPRQLGAAAETLYTVPDGSRAVIRHVHVANPSGSPVAFTMSVGTDAASTRLFAAEPVPAEDEIGDLPNHTLEAGETIQAYASTGSAVVLVVDGYEEAL